MKQKIVIHVCMADLKSRFKAMKIAVGVSGVESAAITGPEKNQLEVVGDGVDVVVLTKLIRKKVAYADIVSVGEAKKEKKVTFADQVSVGEAKKEKAAAETPPPVVPPPAPSYPYYDPHWNIHANAYNVRGQAAQTPPPPGWPFV